MRIEPGGAAGTQWWLFKRGAKPADCELDGGGLNVGGVRFTVE
jgi:hypothetical protein